MLERATFFIIGAGKSGTTGLWSVLNRHPQIAMSSMKEPSFFSQDAAYAKGIEWYHRLYQPDASSVAMGEASNSYSATRHWPDTPGRIAQYNPGAKIVYIVRNPVTRTESDWMEYTRQYDVTFSDFLASNALCHDKNDYAFQYDAYREHFDEDQILLVLFEQLIADQPAVLARLGAFLGLDPLIAFETEGRRRESAEQGQHRALALRLRRSVLYRTLRSYVPSSLRQIASRHSTSTRSIERPTWSSADREQFAERYKERSHKFLTDHNFDPNLWPF
jgi:hypothetical protein